LVSECWSKRLHFRTVFFPLAKWLSAITTLPESIWSSSCFVISHRKLSENIHIACWQTLKLGRVSRFLNTVLWLLL
jgi:hypothetical protein